MVFFFKQKTAYEVRISDWSSDVCSSDLVLGFDVIQTSPISMMIRKGTDQVYAVVEVGERKPDMARINHNGLDVDTDEEVDAAYETLVRVTDEYGLKEIRKPGITHGDYCFYFVDLEDRKSVV